MIREERILYKSHVLVIWYDVEQLLLCSSDVVSTSIISRKTTKREKHRNMVTRIFFVLLLLSVAISFNVNFQANNNVNNRRSALPLQMKWSISKRKGGGPIGGLNFPEQKVVGQEGELYYHPSKIARLKGVPTSKMRTVPLLPHNSNLAPFGKSISFISSSLSNT